MYSSRNILIRFFTLFRCFIWLMSVHCRINAFESWILNLEPPVCYLSPSEHDVILRIHHCCACSFLFGWPPCQRSDMTLVEVSQHAYNYSFIRTIVLFVFLRNSCEPDMVLVYFCWINSVWVWVWVWVCCPKSPLNLITHSYQCTSLVDDTLSIGTCNGLVPVS